MGRLKKRSHLAGAGAVTDRLLLGMAAAEADGRVNR
jgi:hypothetical protein